MRKKFFFLGILLGVCLASPAQFYSARTNLIGLATGNINLEGSMTLNRRWSLHLPVQYNPFVFKDNRQFRNLTVMPGVRYWFVESYSNFFVGMNTLASGYSIGRIWNKKRYEGEGYGIGLSIGKAYPLSKTWNIEWELGGAAVWARYNEYRCRECGAFLATVFVVPRPDQMCIRDRIQSVPKGYERQVRFYSETYAHARRGLAELFFRTYQRTGLHFHRQGCLESGFGSNKLGSRFSQLMGIGETAGCYSSERTGSRH